MTGVRPSICEMYLALGEELSRRKRHVDAIQALRQAMDEDEHHKPVDRIVPLLVGELLSAKDEEGALRTFLEFATTAPDVVLPEIDELRPLLRAPLLQRVIGPLTTTDWAPILSDSGLSQAGRSELLAFLTRALLTVEQAGVARNLLERNAELVAGDSALLMLQSECRLYHHEFDAAERSLLQAESVAADPAVLSEINVGLAALYEQTGQPDKALERVANARRHSAGTCPDLAAIEALARLRLGDRDGANAALADAAPRPNGAESSDLARAHVYAELAQHNYDNAQLAAETILAKAPDNNGASFLHLQAMAEAGKDLKQTERRLKRLVNRMDPAQLAQCIERSTNTRAANDPALHYFSAMLNHALDKHDQALTDVNTALDLLPNTDPPTALEPRAYRLRAMLLEPNHPRDAASDYTTAAELAYGQFHIDRSNLDMSIELFKRAKTLGVPAQRARLVLADALLNKSYDPDAPKGVALQPLSEAMAMWDEATHTEPPPPEESWAYITRAQIKLQFALLDPEPFGLITEALVDCERCYVFIPQLPGIIAPLCGAFITAYRLLGLYGLSVDVLHTTAFSGSQPAYDGAVSDLITAAANAGDLPVIENLLATQDGKSSDEWARCHLLRRDPHAALAVLDEIERRQDRRWSGRLCERVKSLWMLGDRDGVDVVLASAVQVAARGEDVGFDGWIFLLGGDAAKANELFCGYSLSASYFTDPAAEAALSRLAMHQSEPGDTTELLRFANESRSYEDVMTVAEMTSLIAQRYGDPDGTFARAAAIASDRLTNGQWPLGPESDLDHLLSVAVDHPAAEWTPIAAVCARARVATAYRDWSTAVTAYRELVPMRERFPQLEQALVSLAWELADDTAASFEAIRQLQDVVAALRQEQPRTMLNWPPEGVLGDIWFRRDQIERAADCYQSLERTGVFDDVRPYLLTRLSLVSMLSDREDSDELLGAAVRAFRDSGDAGAAQIYETSVDLVKSDDGWRAAIAAWERAAATAPDDIADDLKCLPAYGRRGYARWLADREDRAAEAAVQYQSALSGFEHSCGPDHPDAVATRYELAGVRRHQGDWEAAESEYRTVIAARERQETADSPGVLIAQYWLAMTLAARDDRLAEAETELRALLERERRIQGAENPDTLITHYQLAGVLYRRGDLQAAECDYRAVLAAREQALGPNHQDTLDTRFDLATVLHQLGDFEAAESEYRLLIDGLHRTLGADTENALNARFQLAVLLRERGDLAGAEAGLRAVVQDCRRVLGPDHLGTLGSHLELAEVLQERGDLQQAESEYRSLIDDLERVLGSDDESTVDTRFKLAHLLRERGDLRASESEYRALLAARELHEGPDSPDALSARYWLAMTLAAQDDRLAEAEAELRTLLERERRIQGVENPDTLITQHQLAAVIHRRGDLPGAEAELRAVLAARERVLDPHDQHVLDTRLDLAQLLYDRGDLQAAESEYRNLLGALEQAPATDPEATVRVRSELARLLRERGDAASAEAELRSILQDRERTRGSTHPDTLSIRFELAQLVRERDGLAAAEREYRTILTECERHDNADSPGALMARYWLAMTLAAQDDRLAEAEVELRALLEQEQRVSGANDPSTLITQHQLAGVLHRRDDLQAAESEYRAVLDARAGVLGPDHPDTLDTRLDLAAVLRERGDLQAAECEYRVALTEYERQGNADWPAALIARYWLAMTLAADDRVADAEAELRTVLEQERRMQGVENPDTLITQYQLAGVLHRRGDLQAAESEYRAVLAARERVLGPDHPQSIDTRLALERLLRERVDLVPDNGEYRPVHDPPEGSGGQVTS